MRSQIYVDIIFCEHNSVFEPRNWSHKSVRIQSYNFVDYDNPQTVLKLEMQNKDGKILQDTYYFGDDIHFFDTDDNHTHVGFQWINDGPAESFEIISNTPLW